MSDERECPYFKGKKWGKPGICPLVKSGTPWAGDQGCTKGDQHDFEDFSYPTTQVPEGLKPVPEGPFRSLVLEPNTVNNMKRGRLSLLTRFDNSGCPLVLVGGIGRSRKRLHDLTDSAKTFLKSSSPNI